MKRMLIPARFAAHSLRLRFLLAILFWVALGIGGIWYSATRFSPAISSAISRRALRPCPRTGRIGGGSKDGHLSLSRPLSDPRYLEPMSGCYWQVPYTRATASIPHPWCAA
jgi:hypothetical protein